MGLTVEQRDLRDAVRGLIAKSDDAGRVWPRLCDEIGVAGLAIPERYGGAGAGLAETCVVMEELGRNLTPAPMLGSVVLAAQAVLASGDEEARERLLPAIADGSAIAALAWTTPAGHWDTTELGYDARAVGRRWELNGQARDVLDGAAADVLLVAAATPDGAVCSRSTPGTTASSARPSPPWTRRATWPSSDWSTSPGAVSAPTRPRRSPSPATRPASRWAPNTWARPSERSS